MPNWIMQYMMRKEWNIKSANGVRLRWCVRTRFWFEFFIQAHIYFKNDTFSMVLCKFLHDFWKARVENIGLGMILNRIFLSIGVPNFWTMGVNLHPIHGHDREFWTPPNYQKNVFLNLFWHFQTGKHDFSIWKKNCKSGFCQGKKSLFNSGRLEFFLRAAWQNFF